MRDVFVEELLSAVRKVDALKGVVEEHDYVLHTWIYCSTFAYAAASSTVSKILYPAARIAGSACFRMCSSRRAQRV